MSDFENESNKDDNNSFDYLNDNCTTNRRILKDNPYQTKNIGLDNKDFFRIKKEHYFNNEYAKRNIIVVLSISVFIFTALFFVFFGKSDTSDNTNYSVSENTSKTTQDTLNDNDIIEFKDSNLKNLVIETLEIKDDNVTKKNALNLKNLVIEKESTIESIIDLDNFSNLQSITLKKEVKDINVLEVFDQIELNIENVDFSNISIFDNIFNIEIFEGTIKYSKDIENNGTFVFTDGSYYEGTFINGIIKGEGEYNYSNSGLLKGKFNDIDFSGQSELFYNNANKLFEGLFDGKYTTKSLKENYFNGTLSGTFYDSENNQIFVGKYTGENSLSNKYFDGSLNGNYTGEDVTIKGTITGKITSDYSGDFSYNLNGTLTKNSIKMFDGKFDIVVKNGKEVSCSGTGTIKLPDDFNSNDLYLEGDIDYSIEKNYYNVVGKSYRIINNEKVYIEEDKITPTSTPSSNEEENNYDDNNNKWWH
jgi:hypothetical protein